MWIHQGRLHLVPLEHKSEVPFNQSAEGGASNPSFEPEEEGFIDRVAALELVRDSSIDTFAPSSLEAIVWERINAYVKSTSTFPFSSLN